MLSIKQAHFASLVGVSHQAVSKAIAEGRLPAEGSNGQRGRRVLLNATKGDENSIRNAALSLWHETSSSLPHHQARKDQFEAARQYQVMGQGEKTQQGATEGATDARSVKEQIEAERLRKERAQADAMEMERDKARKTLIDLAYHRFAVREQAEIVRALIESMPHRLAPGLSACRGDVAQITAELESFAHEFMAEVSHGIARRAKELEF